MTEKTIDAIFDQLDRDRHIAGYRLEERASPYFKLFLPELLEKHLGVAINLPIVPEFPFNKEDDTYRSPKVDFFAHSADCDRAFLIELKTDMESLDPSQAKNLKGASKKKLTSLVHDVTLIGTNPNTEQGEKYRHLLEYLSELELVDIPGGEYKQARQNVQREIEPEIIYVLPNCNPATPKGKGDLKEVQKVADCIITFEEIAKAIKGRGSIANRFALSLLEWATVDAGSPQPGA